MAYDPKSSKWAEQVKSYGDESATRGRRLLVYGESGVGKTTLAATLPKPFFIDIDKGENDETRKRSLKYITFAQNGIYGNIFKMLQDFLYRKDIFDPDGGPQGDRETIVLDSWTNINLYILNDICKNKIGSQKEIDPTMERPTISQYGFLLSRQASIISVLKEITDTGRHVIVTALPMVEGSEEEKKQKLKPGEVSTTFEDIVGIPNLVGKYKYAIMAEFDETYHLWQGDESSTRFLNTQRHGIWRAKTREKLDAVITNPTFELLEAQIKKGRAQGVKA